MPVPTKNGNFMEKITLSSGQHIIRVLEYVEGTILQKVTCPPELFYDVGYTVGKLDLDMKNFHHDAYDKRNFLWMLQSVPYLSKFVFAVSDERNKEVVINVIEEFERRVLPISNSLEKGLIHGDVNEQNIIVDKVADKYSIQAIIDFGDTHIGCYLYEVAITMAYMILTSENIESGGYVLAGYHSAKRVSENELSLLKVCVAARLCQSLVMGAYSILQDPENTYVLTTAAKGWTILNELWRQPESEILDGWKSKLKQ
ncbi:unnamed protein product [Phaedon cochleariae]|uniref:Hydroxylysine kinase n=1 Tax=Phaedon cochleariae TaxID=80249 RepID=A0A9P0DUL5_PHACE|nr:unnamed protein product [Phaedon cochleariae]